MEFLDRGATINPQRYAQILKKAKEVKTKNSKNSAKQEDESSTLPADNARPHNSLFFLILPSPDLAPCDFHTFGPLKDALRGRRFVDDV
jgi:hypothetical protein